MSKIILTAALVALVSACSSMPWGRTANSSSAPRTSSMGASGYIGNGPMGDYVGGP